MFRSRDGSSDHVCDTQNLDYSRTSDTTPEITGSPCTDVGRCQCAARALEWMWSCGDEEEHGACSAGSHSVRAAGAVHLAPTPLISTTVRTAQRHLYLFAAANVGLMQPAVDASGTV